jgi:hypothetical protein
MSKDGSEKTQNSQELIPQSGEQQPKNSPTELKNIVAEFAQKNRTLFCICLAFSIWFYHGMFDWSTNFGTRVKLSSETLFVVQVFLTAFAVSRFLVFINIIDRILRMPIICDVIFWASYEDKVLKKAFKVLEENKMFNPAIHDYIINMSSSMTNENIHIMRLKPEDSKKRFYDSVLKYMIGLDAHQSTRYYNHTSEQKENIINPYWNIISDDKGRCRYSIKRYSTRKTKGFFYEETWLPKLFPKLNKEWREKIGIISALLFYAAPIALYFVYQWLFPTPIPIIITEQLFFSYVNKHFL